MMKHILKLSFLVLFSANLSFAQELQDVDHISLASLMLYDDKLDKAQEELSSVNRQASNFDAARFYTVSGVLASKQADYKKAIEMYKKAVKATQTKVFKAPKQYSKQQYLFEIGSKKSYKKQNIFDPEKVRTEKISALYMHLVKEYYQTKQYNNTLNALDKAGNAGTRNASLFTLRADCYWKLKEYNNAINILSIGIEKFPQYHEFLKQKMYYYAELELYQAAINTAQEYIQKVGASPKEYIATAQMLIGANQIDQVILFLEESKLKFPTNAEIMVLLGHMYLKKELVHASAQLFDQSAFYNKKYLKDDIEVNKRAGNTIHALYLNAQNPDKQEKLKQLIAIYLGAEEYRKILGLKQALERYNMLKDENLRYTLAYSYYMVGDYLNAEEQLKHISDNELFSKATVIRKNIEKCTNNTLECL